MQRELVRDGLLFALAECYREDPSHFLNLSKGALDSALTRGIVVELCNEGHIEEEVRGTIRSTPRGCRAFRNDPLPYTFLKSARLGPLTCSFRRFCGNSAWSNG